MRESGPKPKAIDRSPAFSWHIEDEIGVFRVIEDDFGKILIEVINKNGDRVVLNDMLPKDYEAIGNKRVMEDSKFLGLGDVDTSIADLENKVIIVSEPEVKRDGRRYLLTFLHELGHIMRHEQHPELKKERDFASTYSSRHRNDANAYKHEEALIAQDERDAWAFAIREFRKLTDKLSLPKEKIFKNADELKRWVYQTSLGAKADMISKNQIERLPMSEGEKKRLVTEIFRMYTHKKS